MKTQDTAVIRARPSPIARIASRDAIPQRYRVLHCVASIATASALFLTSSSPALAASRTFKILWTSGGSGTASGSMVVDDAVLLNPGNNALTSIPWITAFTVTITGASSGNGTFSLSDYSEAYLRTNGCTLDLRSELVGQNHGGLFNPGIGAGDLNFFANVSVAPTAPTGSGPGVFLSNFGAGDTFTPASITPVLFPYTANEQKCQDAIGALGGKYLATRHKALSKCRNGLTKGTSLFEDQDKMVPVLDWSNCPSEFKTSATIAKARQNVRDGLDKACTDAVVGEMLACASTINGLVDATGSAGCLITSIDTAVQGALLNEYGF